MSETSRSSRAASPRPSASRGNIFSRFGAFIAQIIAELRKVVRPTREQLVSYTMVVVVFVVIMMAIVFGLDQLFMRLIAWTFGG